MRSFSKLTLFCILFFTVAFTGGCIYSTGGEKVIKVADMPDTPEFQTDIKKESGTGTDRVNVDLGYVWAQTKFFWCPVFNSKGRYVGYANSDSTYISLDAGQLKRMAEVGKVNVSEDPKLPFWDAIGGKLVGGVVLLILIGYFILSAIGGKSD